MPELLTFVETAVFTKRISALLYVYGKNEAGSLTPDQKRQLREIVLKIKRSGDKETQA